MPDADNRTPDERKPQQMPSTECSHCGTWLDGRYRDANGTAHDCSILTRFRADFDAHVRKWGTVTNQDGELTNYWVSLEQVRQLRSFCAARLGVAMNGDPSGR